MGDISSEPGLGFGGASKFVVDVACTAGGLLGAEATGLLVILVVVVLVVVAALRASRRAASCFSKASRAT